MTENEQPNQPGTVTTPLPMDQPMDTGSAPAKLPFVPAPLLPNPGAMIGAPLTGQGPHKADHGPQAPQSPKRTVPPQPQRRPAYQPPATPAAQPVTDQSPTQAAPAIPQPVATQPAGSGLSPGFQVPSQPIPITDPAVASLLVQTLNTQRQVSQQFILVILPDNSWPTCEYFEDVRVLISRIQELLNKPYCLFAFLGHRLGITPGPLRFLTTPMGNLPLFDPPQAQEAADDYGWVGRESDIPQVPTTETEETYEPEQSVEPNPPAINPPAAVTETPIFS